MHPEEAPLIYAGQISDVSPYVFPPTAEGQLAMVLWLAWDPVGGGPDEYTSEVPGVLELLRGRPTGDQLAEELTRLRTQHMGMPPRPEIDRHAAWRILDWYAWFVDIDEASGADH